MASAYAWDYAEADVDGLGRMSQQSDGNKIHAGVGVGANIFQADAAGALEGNAAAVPQGVGLGAAVNRAVHFFRRHVIEQDSLSAAG